MNTFSRATTSSSYVFYGHGFEPDSLKKSRFFDVLDRRFLEGKIAKQVYKDCDVSESTAEGWRRKERELDSSALRRTRKLFKKFGRKLKISPEQVKFLVFIDNEIRDHILEAQIHFHKFDCCSRTLQSVLRKKIRNVKMYKKSRVKAISQKNKAERIEYGGEHEAETVSGYWRFMVFSDEAHIDVSTTSGQRILCEEGTRLNFENLQEMPRFEDVFMHLASWCNWIYGVGPLTFYDCFDDSLNVVISKERRPRRRPVTEIEEQYQQRVQEWEARQPHEFQVAGRGNSMTQQYYRDILLSGLCDITLKLHHEHGRGILQEDNDSSHGTRLNKVNQAKGIDNVCEAYRKERGVETVKHSAQSLDLNCMEAVWNIFMARLRRRHRSLGTKAELKAICLEVWVTITIEEVRARIEEMPERCKEVQRREGMGIKSALW